MCNCITEHSSKLLTVLLCPQLYRKKYKQRKENERRGRCRFYPPHVPPIFPLIPVPSAPVPFPLYPPGIIGGDYDQAPVILPRPRFDPIGPLPGHLPGLGVPIGRRSLRPGGSRPADVRRGFIWTLKCLFFQTARAHYFLFFIN